jgi:hypothetical protein
MAVARTSNPSTVPSDFSPCSDPRNLEPQSPRSRGLFFRLASCGSQLGAVFHWNLVSNKRLASQHDRRRLVMPILLLVGVPVVLLGGGYFIIHAMH